MFRQINFSMLHFVLWCVRLQRKGNVAPRVISHPALITFCGGACDLSRDPQLALLLPLVVVYLLCSLYLPWSAELLRGSERAGTTTK